MGILADEKPLVKHFFQKNCRKFRTSLFGGRMLQCIQMSFDKEDSDGAYSGSEQKDC